MGGDGPAPVLLLVGDGPERARLAALIEQSGLRNVARLAGWRKDVERVYPLLDVFTLSSWSEGTSLGLLEAMSAGVCPVVTAVGGSPAVLGGRLRERLVQPGDPTALAEAWRGALTQRERRERSEEHTSELQSRLHLVCRLLLEKKKHSADARLPGPAEPASR